MLRTFKITILLFLSLNLYSQDWVRINELDYDAEFYYLTFQYNQALDFLLQIYDIIPENPSVNYKIGICYLNIEGEKHKAIKHLEQASEHISDKFKNLSYKDDYAPKESLIALGNAYRINDSYDQAIEAFTKYKDLLTADDEYNQKVANQYIRNCNVSKEMKQSPKSILKKNFGELINNNLDNIAATISGDQSTMAFTSISKRGYEIYISKKEGENWGEPKRITNRLANHNYLKTAALSFYGNELYLVYNDPYNPDIYISYDEGGFWSKAKKLKKPINSKSKETHICLSSDGNTMYFTSDRKGGFGDLDIYKSVKNTKGKWEEPENLGTSINTIYKEETPFLSPDDNFLFFSSEGYDGMGGLDIFAVDLSSGNPEPVNLGYPINTTDDDYFFQPNNDGKSGIYSSGGTDSYGLKDIYSVSITKQINLKGNLLVSNQPENESSTYKIVITNVESYENVANLEANSENTRFEYALKPGEYRIDIGGENVEPANKQITIPANYAENDFPFEIDVNHIVQQEEVTAENTEVADSLQEERNTELAANTEVENNTPTETVTSHEPEPVQEEPVQEEVVNNTPAQTEVQEQRNEEPAMEISEGSSDAYVIQLMALKKPAKSNPFKNVDGVKLVSGDDGYYRYVYGGASNLASAKEQLSRIHQLGYKNAYIKSNKKQVTRQNKPTNIPESQNISGSFTIQLLALKKEIDLNYFKNISDVKIMKGNDGYYRYVKGDFNNLKEAQNALKQIHASGHSNAYIKKLN